MKELLKVLEFTADRTQALADSQSVAGEPLHVGDVTLIPVSSISCGFAGGGRVRLMERLVFPFSRLMIMTFTSCPSVRWSRMSLT